MERFITYTDVPRLKRLLAEQTAQPIDAEGMTAALNERVPGQAHMTGDLARFIQLQWGKEKRKCPMLSILLVGSRTGRTDLLKGMAAFLYRNERAVLRCDCSELRTPESTARLIGVPRGYVGAERGGELTRAVRRNPCSLIVFDDIEMAHPGVLDLFQKMMCDGRLTEQGTGDVADFSYSIGILTSNLEADALIKLQEETADPLELASAVKARLVSTGKFRPEIAGHIGKVCVFKSLATI